uniref:Uncharacterized protein n=1 Tax=Anguilla anguilla TaxID=7936 RepID=A0A0E9VZ32_ANGAN
MGSHVMPVLWGILLSAAVLKAYSSPACCTYRVVASTMTPS